MDRAKESIIRKYLMDQQDTNYVDSVLASDFSNPGMCNGTNDDNDMVEVIDQELFDEFKTKVKQWMELDTQIKRLRAAIAVRKKMQGELNDKILAFMADHNIEDLNTKDGVLRFKTSKVKAPLSQRRIKDRLKDKLASHPDMYESVMSIFDERESKERASLRRIKY